jgi:hypothetical protein
MRKLFCAKPLSAGVGRSSPWFGDEVGGARVPWGNGGSAGRRLAANICDRVVVGGDSQHLRFVDLVAEAPDDPIGPAKRVAPTRGVVCERLGLLATTGVPFRVLAHDRDVYQDGCPPACKVQHCFESVRRRVTVRPQQDERAA